MNCYDFELNISAYIDGELKQVVRENFIQHKNGCKKCCMKFDDISKLIVKMPQINKIETSTEFSQKLQEEINKIDNRGPTIRERLIQYIPFGFEPVPAMGFALALTMVISMSYLLLNQDGLPAIDFEKLSTQSKQNIPNKIEPSIINPIPDIPSMADSDTSDNQNGKKVENRIKLVGSKK